MEILDIPPAERAVIADRAEISDAYLYQCLSRRRDMRTRLALHVERVSGGRIKRWHLRRDWWEHWPELVGSKGAPAVPRRNRRLAGVTP